MTVSSGSAALGVIELRGELAGLRVLDMAVKSGGVGSALGHSVCPGKFLVFLTGTVSEVRSALTAGAQAGLGVQSKPVMLPRVHPDVWPALTGTTVAWGADALVVMETYSAASAVLMADAMAKAADVRLLRIRLASGLGGKGIVFARGTMGALREAEAVGRQVAGERLLESRTLASPHPRLWEFVL